MSITNASEAHSNYDRVMRSMPHIISAEIARGLGAIKECMGDEAYEETRRLLKFMFGNSSPDSDRKVIDEAAEAVGFLAQRAKAGEGDILVPFSNAVKAVKIAPIGISIENIIFFASQDGGIHSLRLLHALGVSQGNEIATFSSKLAILEEFRRQNALSSILLVSAYTGSVRVGFDVMDVVSSIDIINHRNGNQYVLISKYVEQCANLIGMVASVVMDAATVSRLTDIARFFSNSPTKRFEILSNFELAIENFPRTQGAEELVKNMVAAVASQVDSKIPQGANPKVWLSTPDGRACMQEAMNVSYKLKEMLKKYRSINEINAYAVESIRPRMAEIRALRPATS